MRNRRLNVVCEPTFTNFGIESTNVRQPSLVDEFYCQKETCSESGEVVIRVSHPLYMLFNQERLDRLGPAAVQQWLSSLESTGNRSVQEVLKKVSDADLLAMVKSRHIQHPSELERYLNDLNERVDLFNSEVARIVAQQKASEVENVENRADNNNS